MLTFKCSTASEMHFVTYIFILSGGQYLQLMFSEPKVCLSVMTPVLHCLCGAWMTLEAQSWFPALEPLTAAVASSSFSTMSQPSYIWGWLVPSSYLAHCSLRRPLPSEAFSTSRKTLKSGGEWKRWCGSPFPSPVSPTSAVNRCGPGSRSLGWTSGRLTAQLCCS